MKTVITAEMQVSIDVAEWHEKHPQWKLGFEGSLSEFTEDLREFLDAHPFLVGCRVIKTNDV